MYGILMLKIRSALDIVIYFVVHPILYISLRCSEYTIVNLH